MSVTTMTIEALCVSPYNARINQEDANAIDALENSLVARGQLYPLIVHPLKAKGRAKKRFGVLDGGRRYRAFARAIETGRLPADHPIEVAVRECTDEGELHDLALAATFIRRDLRDYEIYAAVARALDRGRSLSDIADTNGQTIQTVRQWARLGQLHPTVFAALEADEIGRSVAMAIGATEDVALQLHVFEQFMAHPHRDWGKPASLVRKLLKFGDADLERALRFVGEEAYAKAGGRYELDLFAGEADQRGRVADEGLLMQLHDAKLETIRARVRRQAGSDLRFETAPPRLMLANYDQGVDTGLEITAHPEPVDAADAQWLAELRYEMSYWEGWARFHLDDAELDEDLRAHCIAAIDEVFEPLEDELAFLESRMQIPLPSSQVFATLIVQEEGEPELRFWWASRKDKQKAEAAARKLPDAPAPRPVSAGPIGAATPVTEARPIVKPGAAIDRDYGMGDRQKADTLVRDEHGLTADGIQIMRSLRQTALRATLVLDNQELGDLALDYLLWSLARDRLTPPSGEAPGGRAIERGLAGLSVRQELQPQQTFDHVGRTFAHGVWKSAVAQLKAHPSMTDADLVMAFDSFRADAAQLRGLAAAIVAGLALERSANATGYEVELHDHVAALAGQSSDEQVRSLIEPTEELIALLPKARQLELVHPHVSHAEYLGLEKLKADALPAPVTRTLSRLKDWVHPMLRFRPRLSAIARAEQQMEKAA
ncbi:chromosome partitioning protein, ParB family [Sphingobium sp. AP50]|uniref:ParB/RepB/Spo0J family partition protein n=1 Tax=Sphingobium sp. AP50 TaxID=1884369 RepID=UPI0008ABBB36|nr:ParB/RepB/Spo0J family partition protein [Sphingobium sp. AP50]SEI69378.1 chromosome partitioning protein, ParB family [Sphingobium sp. AP50]